MPIRVNCPFCRKEWSAPDAASGRAGRCPRCGAPGPVLGGGGRGAFEGSRWPGLVGRAAAVVGALALGVAFIPMIALLAFPLALGTATLGILALVLAAHAGLRPRPAAGLGLALSLAALAAATLTTHRPGSRGVSPAGPATVQVDGPHSLPTVPTTVPPTESPGTARPAPANDPFARSDANGDGRLNADELPEALRARFAVVDRDGDGYASRAEFVQASGSPAVPTRGQTLAAAVFTAADDFLVDAWQNGRRVEDWRRQILSEVHGATAEKLDLQVKEGDWLVFQVANNRLRWGGAAYFGVAGVDAAGRVAFASAPDDPRWSYCDDPGAVPGFIARADSLADHAALPPAVPWAGGDDQMKASVPEWAGKSVWGRERTTWIKFVAPAAGTTTTPTRPRFPRRLVRGAVLAGHPGPVECLALTPDGKTAVSGSAPNPDPTAAGNAATVIIWDLAGDPRRRLAIPVGQAVPSLAVTPDGRAVVVPVGNRYEVDALADGRGIASLIGSQGTTAWAVAVAPDGRTVAGSIDQGDVILWDMKTRKATRTLHGGDRDAQRLAFAPDGRLLASGSGAGVVRVWDVATGDLRATCGAPVADGAAVTALAFTPDGRSVAVVVAGAPPTLWDPATGDRRQALGAEPALTYHGFAFAPDGTHAAATAVDPRGGQPTAVVVLLDVATGKILALADDPDGPTRGVAFAADGRTIWATGGTTIKPWEVADQP